MMFRITMPVCCMSPINITVCYDIMLNRGNKSYVIIVKSYLYLTADDGPTLRQRRINSVFRGERGGELRLPEIVDIVPVLERNALHVLIGFTSSRYVKTNIYLFRLTVTYKTVASLYGQKDQKYAKP